MVYIIIDDRTDKIIAVYSALKRARAFVDKREDMKWLVIEYHKLL